MAIVTFYRRGKKETGQTLSMAAIATNMAIEHNYKILIVDTAFQYKMLEECFWPIKKETTNINTNNKGANAAIESGIEGLVKVISSNKTTPEIVRNYCRTILRERLDFLQAPLTTEYKDYAEVAPKYINVLNAANRYYDYVFVDLYKDLPKDVREDIENINSASMNLLDVIDGILDISKIESGKETLVEKEYNVPKFLKDLENITNENIGNKEIKLNLVINPKTPAKLFGDSSRIRQVLNNILNNSIKFTDKGSITIKVDSKKKNNTCDLIISVSDTGCGIEKDKLSRLFDESKKVTNDNSKYIEGMGLTITKKLMDLLNGQIDVESTVGVGTTFTISVNQKLIDDKVIGDINEYVISKKKNSAFDTEGKKVLVVDDNKLNLKVAERLLKPYNVEITTVDSGIKTLELINNGSKFDLILLDQMMPEMDGIETLHNLKNIKGFDIPVIMLTADAIVGKREEYLKAGFDDYLSKPIDTNELNKVLKKFLQN